VRSVQRPGERWAAKSSNGSSLRVDGHTADARSAEAGAGGAARRPGVAPAEPALLTP
jgi:hypothetical protein